MGDFSKPNLENIYNTICKDILCKLIYVLEIFVLDITYILRYWELHL